MDVAGPFVVEYEMIFPGFEPSIIHQLSAGPWESTGAALFECSGEAIIPISRTSNNLTFPVNDERECRECRVFGCVGIGL